MTKKVLLVSDDLRPLLTATRSKKGGSAPEIRVLTLGFDPALAGKELRPVDVSSIAESSAQSVREFIPRFIYEFPKKTILRGRYSVLDLLRYKDMNFWWFNKIPEKGALWSKLIKRLYYFDLIITECSSEKFDELWMECGDRPFVELVRRNRNKLPNVRVIRGRGEKRSGQKIFILSLFINNLRVLFSASLKTLIVKKQFTKTAAGERKPSIAFFSFYPLFWSRDGKKESFFASAPKKVPENEKAVYLTWFSMGARDLFKKARDYLDPGATPERAPLEAYLGMRDYLSIFCSLVLYFFRASGIFIRSGKINEDYKDYDISNIAADELFSGLSGQETAMCLLIKRAFENYCSKNPLKAVVFRAEFQPHERALISAAKGRCLSVAFQHQAIGRNFVQYFFPKKEIEQAYKNAGCPDVQPLADKYIVAGKYPYEALACSGFREDDIKIAGPVRYSGLVGYRKNRKGKDDLRKKHGLPLDRKIVLVTPPAAKNEVLNFAATLAGAVPLINEKYLYLFKSHPVFKFSDEIETLLKEHCPDMDRKYLEDSVNLNEYLTLADCLVLSGTTVGIEAICLGTVPVLLDNLNLFSLNPLTEIKDALFWVTGSRGLADAISSAVNNDEKSRSVKANWRQAIEKIFYNIDEDPDERFAGIIEEWMKRQ